MNGVRSERIYSIALVLFMLTRLIGGNRVITLAPKVEQHFLVTVQIGVVLVVAMIILMFITRDRRK